MTPAYHGDGIDGQSANAATTTDVPSGLLCGHWTFTTMGGEDITARCDLPQGHEGMHKYWWSPQTFESFSWHESYERHERRAS